MDIAHALYGVSCDFNLLILSVIITKVLRLLSNYEEVNFGMYMFFFIWTEYDSHVTRRLIMIYGCWLVVLPFLI